MFTLYYVPRTRAGRARWMLEEIGAPYELHRVDLAAREHRSADYLARVHPLGHVPALSDGTTTVFESAAIVAWLADRFPEKKLAPAPSSPERGLYYQWMFYAMAELEPHCATYAQHTASLPEAERIPAVAEAAKAAVHKNLRALEGALAGERQFVLDEFSAADVVIGGVIGWAFMMGLLEGFPLTAAYSKRLAAREASKRARAD